MGNKDAYQNRTTHFQVREVGMPVWTPETLALLADMFIKWLQQRRKDGARELKNSRKGASD